MSGLAGRESPLGTLAQSLGRLPSLIRHMRPTWSLGSLAELDPSFVARHGIAGLIWDVDGTLTAYHRTELLPEAVAPFAALRAVPGLRHAILSNAPEWRFLELGTMFPDIPVIRGYAQGGAVIARRLLGKADTWAPWEHETRLAAGAVPLRKPSADLVRLAVDALGVPASAVVMVGDQHLTDVAGAGLAGVRSIKLPNPTRATFPVSIRISQRLEAALFALVHGRAASGPPAGGMPVTRPDDFSG